MTQRNKLNLKLRPFLAPINSQAVAFLMLGARLRWQSKKQEGLLGFSRSINFFCTATKIKLASISRAAWQQRCNITKVSPWRKDALKGHAPFYFYLYLHLKPREKCFFFRRWVAWSWHNIQRSTVSCIKFVSLAFSVKLQAHEANNWRRSATSNPGNWVCVLFLFFPSYFLYDQTNILTQTREVRAKRRGKVERRHLRAVRFTRFVDYRLMFDSGRSISV